MVAGVRARESEVAVDVAEDYAHREFFGELARIANVERQLIGVEALRYCAAAVVGVDFAEREIAERGAEGLIVARAELPVAGEVGEEDVVDEFAQPGGVAQAELCCRVGESIFRGIPELGVDVGVGGGAEVAHRSAAGIGSDTQREHTGLNRIEVIFLGHRGQCAERQGDCCRCEASEYIVHQRFGAN